MGIIIAIERPWYLDALRVLMVFLRVETLSVQSMTGDMDHPLAMYGIFVVILFSAAACLMREQGIRRYNSANS